MKEHKKRAPETAISETPNKCQSTPNTPYYIIKEGDCQEILSKPSKELQKMSPKKELTGALSKSYQRLGLLKRADFVKHCGDRLQFLVSIKDNALTESKLTFANFCRDRLCPLCTYRKTLRTFNQLSSIMNVIGDKYRFLMLTLTIPNVVGDELPNTIDKLMKGIDRLFKRSRVKKAVKGYFRALEVTRNEETGTYHPHYHFILAVNKSYFTNDEYIKRDEWLKYWQDAMNDYTITQVDIRVIKPSQAKKEGSQSTHNIYEKAVAEVGKYTVKSEDYIFVSDPTLMDEVVSTINKALHGRRLVHLSGIFKKVAKDLKIDFDDPTLTDEVVEPLTHFLVITYEWTVGFKSKSMYKPLSIEHMNTATDSGLVVARKYNIK